jgi:hypothetical protein
VGNDPINYVDPSGLADLNLIGGIEPIDYLAGVTIGLGNGGFNVTGHGTVGHILVGASKNGKLISASALAKMIKEHPDYKVGQPVNILSCNSGTDTGNDGDSLSQGVANILKVPVTGVRNGMYKYYPALPFLNGPDKNAHMRTFYPIAN